MLQRRTVQFALAILILDEATSALDMDTEKEIMEGIFKLKKNKTVLIVAHRLSTVSICDEVVKLDKGKIIEEGTYKELTKQTGSHLKKMVEEQVL